jgi:2-(1,2-epoxy-1,2-dihydrophenyl)acetyl-CoA isomerase
MEDGRSSAEGLTVSADGGVLTVVMDDPARRNALNDARVSAFIEALQDAQNDESVRAVLVRGAGHDFCSGFDIVSRNSPGGPRPRVGSIQRRLPSQTHRLIPMLLELQVPVVAAVRGYAVGIGLQLALACDFAVVAADAVLWEPFVARGMTPDGGASWLLPRAIGLARARRMLLLGEQVSGTQAYDWGLVHACESDATVDAAAASLAQELAAGPTVALGLTKALVNRAAGRDLAEQLNDEGLAMELGSRSPDFREGLEAFATKRPPTFTGR